MSSSTTHDEFVIRLRNVSKIYKLHGSQGDQLIYVLGLQRFGFKTKTTAQEFSALSDISIDVPRGRRIGIVGRNGAGKTTLLKLICGNFAPTKGEVEVNGTVQALMNVGLGFHVEYTGRQNVEASLLYNGLGRNEYQQAMAGIIEFCELGSFLDQPFKTYSLGMQARLMFATATAIRPDILIVDEVLGAGDAYFVAKSKKRVEKLVSSGCTMLLVSHSMQQVLELCDEAIWLDQGRIRMRGDCFLVVKAYEEYMHGPIFRAAASNISAFGADEIQSEVFTETHLPHQQSAIARTIDLPSEILLQAPNFIPHAETPRFPVIGPYSQFDFVAPGGISRWDSEPGLKVCGFTVITERGRTNKLIALRPSKFIITIMAERGGTYHCRYGIAMDNHLGNSVTRIYSPPDQFEITGGSLRTVEIVLNPTQFGPGEYTLGISVLEHTPLEQINGAHRYDLLSRSFLISVELPDSLLMLGGAFIHSAEWSFVSGTHNTMSPSISLQES
jgi:lipopolysaccharide transport system ATP-binding protein